jgi:hypothetical protein
MKSKGQCFVNSYQLLMTMDDSARLVHGIVWHVATGWHIHGWVELNGFCFDNANLAVLPQDRYYQLGKVKTGEGEIFKYTRQEAVKKSLKIGKYYFSKLPCKR